MTIRLGDRPDRARKFARPCSLITIIEPTCECFLTPVMRRTVFGVLGTNIPTGIRGLIAVVWYSVQIYLASAAPNILSVSIFPSLASWTNVDQHDFLRCVHVGRQNYIHTVRFRWHYF